MLRRTGGRNGLMNGKGIGVLSVIDIIFIPAVCIDFKHDLKNNFNKII